MPFSVEQNQAEPGLDPPSSEPIQVRLRRADRRQTLNVSKHVVHQAPIPAE